MTKPHRTTSALLVLPLLAAIGFAACEAGAQDPPAPSGSAAAEAGAPAAPSAAEAGSAHSYEVTIASGPFAGTHRGTDELNCMIHDGSWGADFSSERDRGVSALLVSLEGVSETGGSTEDVNLMLTFGRLGDPSAGGVGVGSAVGGTARATAERDGAAAVMRVEGKTSYGAAVSAVVRCSSAD